MPTSTHHDLLDACKKTGCPVCRLEQHALERYIDYLLYESVNEVKIREQLRGSLGFCKEHTRLALNKRHGNALGFAIIYHDVINNILKGLEKGASSVGGRGLSNLLKQTPEQANEVAKRVVHALTPHKHCIVCHQQEKTLQMINSALVEGLEESQMQEALRASDGLCIPHLKKAFEAANSPIAFDALLSIHREKMERLRDELAEYIRKNDYRYSDEGFGEEGNSWLRAAQMLSGNRPGKQE
jgi:hypothetical protein